MGPHRGLEMGRADELGRWAEPISLDVVGPELSVRLLEDVRAHLVRNGSDPGPMEVAAALREQGLVLADDQLARLTGLVRQELTGAGPLEHLLRCPGVTDVLVNGPDEVWLDRGTGLERTELRLGDEAAVRRLAQRLAVSAGRRLDDASPYVDAQLPDGSRLHAVLPPLSVGGTVLSLRVPRRLAMSLADLAAAGALSGGMQATLASLARAKVALLVTGGTGSGKTTLLSALVGAGDPTERVVVVEDCAEMVTDHPHVLRLQARPANVEGRGEVTMRELVRQALRMRPDRLVVGEARGAEIVELLAALNTGHEGGLATLHANEVSDVPARVEALALPTGMPRGAVHAQLGAGVQAVVHLVREAGARRVATLGWVRRGPTGVSVVPALTQTADLRLLPGPAVEQLGARLGKAPWLVGPRES